MGPPPPVQTSKETEKRFLDALDQLDLVREKITYADPGYLIMINRIGFILMIIYMN